MKKFLGKKFLLSLKRSVSLIFLTSSSFFFLQQNLFFKTHSSLSLTSNSLKFFISHFFVVAAASDSYWWNPLSWNWFGYKDISNSLDNASSLTFWSFGLFLILTLGFSISSLKNRSSISTLLQKDLQLPNLASFLSKA